MALANGDCDVALEWLAGIPGELVPKDLLAEAHYQAAKSHLCHGDDVAATAGFQAAVAAKQVPLFERRLALQRRRHPMLDDRAWTSVGAAVDPPDRLGPSSLQDAVSAVYACGAYHSRGRHSGDAWSTFLRLSKDPPSDPEERAAAVGLAAGYFCRVLGERTPLLKVVDVVVAVPAHPARYNQRGISLPDELARGVERQLGVPWELEALRHSGKEIELRGLSRWERNEAIRGSMLAGELGVAAGRVVLLVDDVTTSGATLREGARVLRDAGAADVVAMTMSHTEG